MKVAYPWVMSEEYIRTEESIQSVKSSFQAASSNTKVKPLKPGSVPQENHGVFAKKRISKGERLLLDRSIYSAINFRSRKFCSACCGVMKGSVISTECCKTVFCSKACKTAAMDAYHSVLCGKDFSWLLEWCKGTSDRDNAMILLLLVKVFAAAVQKDVKPLKVASIGGLYAGLGHETQSYFTLYENVIAP